MIGIAYEKPKLAALLFDYVVPVPDPSRLNALDGELDDFIEQMHEVLYEGASIPELQTILPNEVDELYFYSLLIHSAVAHYGQKGDSELRKYQRIFESRSGAFGKLFALVSDSFLAGNHTQPLLQGHIGKSSLLSLFDDFEVFGRSDYFESEDFEPHPFVEFSNIPIIDDTKISWSHVIEIREDKSAIAKLRRLRAFFTKNYKGLTRQEIEDDLLTRIDDYEKTAGSLGLETTNSIFSIGGSEKIAAALVTGSLATILGAPISIASAIGASATLSGLLIQVVTHRKLFELKQQKDPVRYLVDLKNIAE